MKKITILLLLIFTYTQVCAQNDNFNTIVRKSEGDLNNDGLSDLATISMDTIHSTKPLKLEVFLSLPNKKYELFFSSTKTIQAMYPIEKNGAYNGSQIPDVYIEKGKLLLDFYIKGNSRYEFVLKNGEFNLIHFSYTNWDGVNITETKFNLLTGKYSKTTTILESSQITLNKKKKVKIRPLPKLENFRPFENELY